MGLGHENTYGLQVQDAEEWTLFSGSKEAGTVLSTKVIRKQVVHKVCCSKNDGRKHISGIDVDSQNQRLGRTHFTLVKTERIRIHCQM